MTHHMSSFYYNDIFPGYVEEFNKPSTFCMKHIYEDLSICLSYYFVRKLVITLFLWK
jgi:hypothetical protein